MTIEPDPVGCIRASVAPEGGGGFVVYVQRADGEPVQATHCESAASAAALLREMNPPNVDALLATLESPRLESPLEALEGK